MMDHLMFNIMQNASTMAPKDRISFFDDHSCHKFIVHEDIRSQDLTSTEDERDASTPRKPATPYFWLLPFHTPIEERCNLTFASTPTSFSPNCFDTSSTNNISGFISPSIKQELLSEVEDTTIHPFSVEALLGDVIDKEGDSTKPAEVFSSTYINGEINKCVMYQSLITNMLSQEGLIQQKRDSQLNVVYWCHVCNATCVNNEDAQRHRISHVTNGDQCRLKRAVYNNHGCVTVHERMNDDRIHCGLCDKVVSHCFFSKHQRLHEGHFCEECGKEFSTNSRLQDHRNTHTGKTPFTCKFCDRQFAKRSSLTQHQRYHRDNNSYMCQYCKKRFNSKYTCAVHERLHTGENPYKCEYPGCQRTYPQKIQLKLHMNSHR